MQHPKLSYYSKLDYSLSGKLPTRFLAKEEKSFCESCKNLHQNSAFCFDLLHVLGLRG